MKRIRQASIALAAITLLVSPGRGCSPVGSSAVFVQTLGPDLPYATYIHGRLGVIARTYRIRHMVVAYNILSGRGLSPAEQRGADQVDTRYHSSDDGSAHGDGLGRWLAEVGDTQIATDRQVPGQQYASFANCLDDAFARAASKLAALRASYSKPGSADTPEVQDWIAGQQAVFSNCSSSGRMPQPVPATAPSWLRQERAYQIAAAKFYAADYPGALAAFQAIAADKSSPNAPLARYVVARVLIRQGVMGFDPNSVDAMNPVLSEHAGDAVQKPLQQARAQLEGILADPSMKAWQRQSRQLLDLVMLRVDPARQAEELAKRVTETPTNRLDDATYKQAVIDLGYAYRGLPESAWPTIMHKGKVTSIEPQSGFLRWIDDMYGSESPGQGEIGLDQAIQRSRTDAQRRRDALETWRSTHGLEWLVAALTLAQPGDPDDAELIAAANAVPPTSPAFAGVTYHRLRLETSQPKGQVSYQEVSALLPEIERTQSRSTFNLFLDTQAGLAPTLESFLRSAMRLPASYTDEDGNEEGASAPDYPIATNITLCGVNIYAPKTPHFDNAVATIFNQRMPLSLLRDAALSPALSDNLRFQLAHMTWTRALMLDQPEIVRALSPMLAGCQPAIKPWLDSYNAAATEDERHVLGLLAMMRFTSAEPLVRVGGERDFAAYSSYRDNWWCNDGPDTYPSPAPNQPKPQKVFSQLRIPYATQPDPPFLTDQDRAQVKTELAKFEHVPCASDYFGQQALAWVDSHPNDSRNPDVLGFAMRVIRNACGTDATKEIDHRLFDTLHRRYPKSEWAAKYKTWG